jgi:hypothetical protein
MDLMNATIGNLATGQVRHPRPPTGQALLIDHRVLAHCIRSLLRPACRRIDTNVPAGRSMLGLPATVTVPGLMFVEEPFAGRARPPD